MAAALWHGGISFGGVISFIFADLLALPLILIYRKYYGGRLTLRLVGVFYVVMVAAGLVVEGLFTAARLDPDDRTGDGGRPTHFQWNYTTVPQPRVPGGLRRRSTGCTATGSGSAAATGYAIDPVCGMQVRTADAPATATVDGTTWFFCSDRCRDQLLAEPARYARAPTSRPHPTTTTSDGSSRPCRARSRPATAGSASACR